MNKIFNSCLRLMLIESHRQKPLFPEERTLDIVEEIVQHLDMRLPEGIGIVDWNKFLSVDVMGWWIATILETWVNVDLGPIYRRGDFDESLIQTILAADSNVMLSEVENIAGYMSKPEFQSQALSMIAKEWMLRGNVDNCDELLKRSESLAYSIQDQKLRSQNLLIIVTVIVDVWNDEQFVERALLIATNIEERNQKIEAYKQIIRRLVQLGRFEQAQTLAQSVRGNRIQAELLMVIVEAFTSQNRLSEAYNISCMANHKYVKIMPLLKIVNGWIIQDNFTKAIDVFDEIASIRTKYLSNEKRQILDYLIKENRLEKATEILISTYISRSLDADFLSQIIRKYSQDQQFNVAMNLLLEFPLMDWREKSKSYEIIAKYLMLHNEFEQAIGLSNVVEDDFDRSRILSEVANYWLSVGDLVRYEKYLTESLESAYSISSGLYYESKAISLAKILHCMLVNNNLDRVESVILSIESDKVSIQCIENLIFILLENSDVDAAFNIAQTYLQNGQGSRGLLSIVEAYIELEQTKELLTVLQMDLFCDVRNEGFCKFALHQTHAGLTLESVFVLRLINWSGREKGLFDVFTAFLSEILRFTYSDLVELNLTSYIKNRLSDLLSYLIQNCRFEEARAIIDIAVKAGYEDLNDDILYLERRFQKIVEGTYFVNYPPFKIDESNLLRRYKEFLSTLDFLPNDQPNEDSFSVETSLKITTQLKTDYLKEILNEIMQQDRYESCIPIVNHLNDDSVAKYFTKELLQDNNLHITLKWAQASTNPQVKIIVVEHICTNCFEKSLLDDLLEISFSIKSIKCLIIITEALLREGYKEEAFKVLVESLFKGSELTCDEMEIDHSFKVCDLLKECGDMELRKELLANISENLYNTEISNFQVQNSLKLAEYLIDDGNVNKSNEHLDALRECLSATDFGSYNLSFLCKIAAMYTQTDQLDKALDVADSFGNYKQEILLETAVASIGLGNVTLDPRILEVLDAEMHSEVYFRAVEHLIELDKIEEADKVTNLIESQVCHAYAKLCISTYFYCCGNVERAEQELNKAVEIMPSTDDVKIYNHFSRKTDWGQKWFELSQMLIQQGEFQKAREVISFIAKKDYGTCLKCESYLKLVHAYLAQGDYTQALEQVVLIPVTRYQSEALTTIARYFIDSPDFHVVPHKPKFLWNDSQDISNGEEHLFGSLDYELLDLSDLSLESIGLDSYDSHSKPKLDILFVIAQVFIEKGGVDILSRVASSYRPYDYDYDSFLSIAWAYFVLEQNTEFLATLDHEHVSKQNLIQQFSIPLVQLDQLDKLLHNVESLYHHNKSNARLKIVQALLYVNDIEKAKEIADIIPNESNVKIEAMAYIATYLTKRKQINGSNIKSSSLEGVTIKDDVHAIFDIWVALKKGNVWKFQVINNHSKGISDHFRAIAKYWILSRNENDVVQVVQSIKNTHRIGKILFLSAFAKCLFEEQRHKQCIEVLSDVFNLAKGFTESRANTHSIALYEIAMVWFDIGEVERCLQILNMIPIEDNKNSAITQVSMLLALHGRFDQSISIAEGIKKLDFNLWKTILTGLLNQSEFERALSIANTISKDDDRDMAFKTLISDVLSKNQFEKSLEVLSCMKDQEHKINQLKTISGPVIQSGQTNLIHDYLSTNISSPQFYQAFLPGYQKMVDAHYLRNSFLYAPFSYGLSRHAVYALVLKHYQVGNEERAQSIIKQCPQLGLEILLSNTPSMSNEVVVGNLQVTDSVLQEKTGELSDSLEVKGLDGDNQSFIRTWVLVSLVILVVLIFVLWGNLN